MRLPPRSVSGAWHRIARAPALALACAVAVGLAGSGARAQSFLGTGPAERLTVPPVGDALRKPNPSPSQSPAQPSAAPGRPPAEAPDATRRSQVQATIAPARRLAAGTRGFRPYSEEDALQ
ncbi:hypothetical protein ABEV34_27920 [Methylorubrum rhodesianum]|uniref:hypothetical protein n=1 Tax=Methylorubrum rhodesianum TaxID=29427 RepID=UPI003D2ADB50